MPGDPDPDSKISAALAERITLALEAANTAVWDWDIEQNLPWNSLGVQALFGRGDDELAGGFDLDDGGHPWTSNLHPDDHAEVLRRLHDHLENDTPYQVEYRYCLPSGEYIWIRSTGQAIRAADGRALSMVGSSIDITDRKASEEAQRESERRLRLITDNLPAFVAYVDVDGYYRFANRYYEIWFTRSVDKIVGRHVEDVMGPDNFAVISDSHRKALCGEATTRFGEFVSTDGRKSYVFARYMPDFGSRGVVRGYYILSQDITELKNTEDALHESETRLAEAQQIANLGSWSVYIEGNKQIEPAWSAELCRIFGIAQDAVPPDFESFLRHVHEEDRDRVKHSWSTAREEPDTPYTLEHRIVRPSGEVRYLLTKARSFKDKALAGSHWTGATIDISERKLAEDALRESEQRYRAVADLAQELIWIHTDGVLVYCNDYCAHSLGLKSPEELIGRTILSILHPDEHAAAAQRISEMLTKGSVIPRVVRRLLRQDGGIIIAEIAGRAFTYRGKPSIFSVGRDITENERAEEALHKSQSHLQEAQRIANIGSWEFNEQTGELTWSDEVYRIFGVQKGVFRPNLDSFSEMVHPDDQMIVSRALERSERGSKDYSYELRIVRPDDEIRTVRVAALAFTDEGGELSRRAGTVQDITEQSKAEEQLRQAMKMDAVGRLTGGIAHDFNNLMTIVKINLSMLQDGNYANLQPQLVEEALEACQRGASLTHRLLAYSRRQTLQPVSADLNEVMTGILNLLERTLGAHISIETLSRAGLAQVMIDVNELETALINLATNARDAMPDGGELSIKTANVTLDAAQAERGAVDAGHYVVLSVSDTGSGIAEDIIDDISEPFFTTKDVGKGSGLGLSMVQGFVTQSGGHMTITSAPDKGTTVSIFLPAIIETLSGGKTKGGADHPRGSGQKILVVEDDNRQRREVVRMLANLGYVPLHAEDGRAALAALESTPDIKLLLSDVVLEGDMGSLKIVEEALHRLPGLKVLFGSSKEIFAQLGDTKPGEINTIEKPYDEGLLATRIAEMIGSTSPSAD